MKKFECLNVSQVRNKITELTQTPVMGEDEKEFWKQTCHAIKGRGNENNYDSVDYTNSDDTDISVWIGWDAGAKTYLVGIEDWN